MRKLLFFLLFFSFAYGSNAQAISLKQLLKFRQMEQERITRKLSKKGWFFMVDNKPTEEMMGKAVWAYKPVAVGNMEAGAVAWCVLYYSAKTPSRILYNYFGQTTLSKINKKIRQKAIITLEKGNALSGVSALAAYTDVADKELVFRIMTYDFPDRFGIKIFDKEDYLEAKRNDRL